MIPFQVVGVIVCILFVLWAGRRWRRHQRPRWISLLGVVVGLLGTVAILDPELTTEVARTLGIGRGADLLTYLMVLAFLGSWFYFFQRTRSLSSAITALTRELALRSPRAPSSHAAGNSREGGCPERPPDTP